MGLILQSIDELPLGPHLLGQGKSKEAREHCIFQARREQCLPRLVL